MREDVARVCQTRPRRTAGDLGVGPRSRWVVIFGMAPSAAAGGGGGHCHATLFASPVTLCGVMADPAGTFGLYVYRKVRVGS